MLTESNNPKSGALNLLHNCLEVQAGDSVLLILEPDESLYEHAVGQIIKECLIDLDAKLTVMVPKLISDPKDFPDSVSQAMKNSAHTLFLSRVGDYIRFVALPGSGNKATSYTLSTTMLGSPYASIDNHLLHELQCKLEQELMQASTWRLQCPIGTDLHGEFCWPSLSGGEDDDLTVTLFPVSTFKPVPCDTASGQVALSRWLMPGGAAKLQDADMTIDGIVHAQVTDGNVGSFRGSATDVARINRHYDYVSDSLGINRNRIHSWHAGINPQTRFDQSADDNLDLWSAISFGSPRYLHFHTCGDEPPGEIAWSVFNPTVTIDDELYWKNGEFVWLQRADNKALIKSIPGAHYLLQPSMPIGVDSRSVI